MSGTQRVRPKLKLLTSRRWRVGLGALLPVSAILVGVLTASPASAESNPSDSWSFGLIQSAMQGGPYDPACLDDWNGTTNNYNPVVAYPCNYNDHGQWWAIDKTNDTIHPAYETWLGQIVPNYLVCLDVYAGGGIGADVELYQCNNTGAQQWLSTANFAPGAYGLIINPQTHGCLDLPSYGQDVTPPGGPPTQEHIWTCNIDRDGGAYQQWSLS